MTRRYRSLALTFISLFFFSASLLAQVNNNCANAKLITSDSICSATTKLVGETLTGATNQVYTLTSSCSYLATASDVWYKFAARTKYPTITVSNPGSGWPAVGNIRIQIFAGICGSFTEKACGVGPSITPALTSPLIEGDTCYIRIHKNVAGVIAANHTFDICVTDPLEQGNRMNEVFTQTVLSGAGVLSYPWEVTYGPDDSLWITESRGYRVYKMSAATGVKRMVLDISQGSTFLPAAERPIFNAQYAHAGGPAQGGLAGLALHPDFLSGNNSVYISYIYSNPGGNVYTNKLVMFTYDETSGILKTPVALCDTLPGSNDHNSQRMIIAPITPGGTKYLFYASGDMGAGQGSNVTRVNKSQAINSYEGKILRFNLVSDGDPVIPVTNYLDEWIPSTVADPNPYNALLTKQSAVWSIGMRNNQGFAYDNDLNILYGTSHGAYSDDELNIIEGFRNYGHPLIMGYVADGNYDGDTSVAATRYGAGAPFATVGTGYSKCPPISSESSRKTAINALPYGQYKDPIFSAYPGPSGTGAGTPRNIWTNTTGANGSWPSEGWSGIGLYKDKMIPGWYKSIIAGGLKWGRVIKLKLGSLGSTTMPSDIGGVGNSTDTVTYFQSVNRYRDIEFGPNGKDIYLVMDNSAATSGPGTNNPIVAACPGCVVKYSFLGYKAATAAPGLSLIPKTVDITTGVADGCNTGTPVTIDGSNNFLWVPITGPDGNIMAEINAMGQSLGVVTSSFYRKSSGSIRYKGGVPYLDRNITITPTVNGPYATNVKVRLYLTKTEFDDFVNDPTTGLTNINQLKVLKNNDACGASMVSTTTALTPTNVLPADLLQGPATAPGYVLQVNVPGFSSFYFAENNVVLPLDMLTFTGSLQNNTTTLLKWKTDNEINTSHFVVERSIDGTNFNGIGSVAASGNTSTTRDYSFNDADAANQGVAILYYRLKVADITGSYKYSNTISVTLTATKGIITVSPNPAFNELKASIVSPAAGNAAWQIIDNTGRTIMYSNILLKKGNNDLPININRLAAGTYYLSVSGTSIDVRTKFQKL